MTASVNPPTATPARRRSGPAVLALAVLLAAPLGGCSVFGAPEELRGNRADMEMLKDITPGVSSKADVTALLGSPSATSTFDASEWYYISATTHLRPARTPGIDNQRVVVVRFNDRDIVQVVEQKGERDMRDVTMVERTTPVPGNDRSLLQALFGNIGRFGPTPTTPEGPGGGSGIGSGVSR
ncbi:outer membrane protein assembly factor BamE [Pararoseomonas indoligenes]|uniref:Outer membrane protein assembly factor BamE n=1 Tax=Roseomonas indoligenes TaxID=2820811 RepID=A0A940MYY3_9PROT|nr:outer membrane protein assembly factor BamE [Pararoseomonas indoligenes]MBP0492275.1 outer membrane protein assembly factor BamE [Pararoseomonas indoligenes]